MYSKFARLNGTQFRNVRWGRKECSDPNIFIFENISIEEKIIWKSDTLLKRIVPKKKHIHYFGLLAKV